MAADFAAVLDIVKTFVEIVAIVAAAVWGYYKFVKGRLFNPKAAVHIGGELLFVEDGDHIKVCVEVRNLGFTRLVLKIEYCALQVFVADSRPPVYFTDAVHWTHVATMPILRDHDWIEPSESVQEKELIALDRPVGLGVRVTANVSDGHALWRASTVFSKGPSNHQQKGDRRWE
ncbi:MAG: hypothetical protein HYY01_07815 [Chloroflexi bacterium]|nr:hypothetical protein [Chloroflexota bacterium]